MIALEKIIGRIEEENAAACAAVSAEGAAQLRLAEEDAAWQRSARQKQQERSLHDALSAAADRAHADLRRARRDALLQTRQKLMDQAFDRAGQALDRVDAKTKARRCIDVLAQVQAEGQVCKLYLPEKERATVGAAVQKACPPVRLAEEPCESGFRVRCGAVEIDATVAAQLEQLRRSAAAETANILFGGADDGT